MAAPKKPLSTKVSEQELALIQELEDTGERTKAQIRIVKKEIEDLKRTQEVHRDRNRFLLRISKHARRMLKTSQQRQIEYFNENVCFP